MPYMIDMRHYLDVADPLLVERIPTPARRIAAFFGSIVKGVTAGWDDATDGCPVVVRCIGRLGRRRCTDRVVARIQEDGTIEWVCLTCGEQGIIHHWQGTPWDVTGRGNEIFPAMDVIVELEMSLAEYEAVAAIQALDAEAERVLAAGRMPDEDLVTISAPRAWLEHLVESIASEASRSRSKQKVALFEAILDRADRVV